MLADNHKAHEIITEEAFLRREEYALEASLRLGNLRTSLETKAANYELVLKRLKIGIDNLATEIRVMEEKLSGLR
jgi:hypothetical protein